MGDLRLSRSLKGIEKRKRKLGLGRLGHVLYGKFMGKKTAGRGF